MDALSTGPSAMGAADPSIRDLSNDALIIRLIQTMNRLSRWLSPIHDQSLLEFSVRRSESSVKELLIRLRDTETQTYTMMYAIATEQNPDLDRIPRYEPSAVQVATDRSANSLVIMSGFRRVRESTTALLRALPDTAWQRGGFSRTQRNWTIRQLAEFLAGHDHEMLTRIDRSLARSGARHGIAEVSQVDLGHIEEPFLATANRK